MSDDKNLPAQQNQSQVPAVFNFFDSAQFETMQRVCKMFAMSELVPEMYQASEKNPLEKAMANCMIAIEMSQRMQASALMIMQNMVIIYGRPSWSSTFLIATVNTCGRFNPLQFRFKNLGPVGKISILEYDKTWVNGTNGAKGYYKQTPKTTEFDGTKLDNIECVAFTTARGGKDILESAPVTIKLAVDEGWYLKAGSKWKTMSQQMLMYRAASFWTKVYAPEVSMGMRTTEEILDTETIDITHEDVTNQAPDITTDANKAPIDMTAAEGEQAGPKVEETPAAPAAAAKDKEKAFEGQKPVEKAEPTGKAPDKPGAQAPNGEAPQVTEGGRELFPQAPGSTTPKAPAFK